MQILYIALRRSDELDVYASTICWCEAKLDELVTHRETDATTNMKKWTRRVSFHGILFWCVYISLHGSLTAFFEKRSKLVLVFDRLL